MKIIHILLIVSVFACNNLGAMASKAIDYTPFFGAVVSADKWEIKRFIKSNAEDMDIDYRNEADSGGMTALYLASFFDDTETARLLLDCGANVDKGFCCPNPFINFFNITDNNDSEHTPLMLACENKNITLATLLLSRGADVNKGSSSHGTPLHIAAKSGNKELVQLLLIRDAKPDGKDEDGQTADKIAEKEGHHDIAQLIKSRNPEKTIIRVKKEKVD
jgi:ankyrin repeat protein